MNLLLLLLFPFIPQQDVIYGFPIFDRCVLCDEGTTAYLVPVDQGLLLCNLGINARLPALPDA